MAIRSWAVVRAGGLFLVLIGLWGGIRRSPIAPALIAFEEPALMAPAAIAMVVALTALSGSTRERLGQTWRLALSAATFGGAEVVFALEPDAVFGQGASDPLNYLAHALKLVSFVALGFWLWTGVRTSIRTRFVAAFAGLLMVVVLALAGTLTGVLSDNVQDEELSRLESQLRNAAQGIGQDEAQQLLQQVEVVGSLDVIRSVVAARRDLPGLASELAGGDVFGEYDFALIIDSRGRLLGAAGTRPAGNEAAAELAEVTVVDTGSAHPRISGGARRGRPCYRSRPRALTGWTSGPLR